MAVVVAAPPSLSGDLALFHTTDPLLANSPVLIFHGPAVTIGATSSRIQVHIFTPAGIGSYARLAVSPTSPLYSAVANLPREEQGDEICRGLAFGLKRYFSELAENVKKIWCAQAKAPSPGMLFGDDHIAVLATRMTRIDNVDEVIADLTRAFAEQRQSWLDVDVVLPPGSIKDSVKRTDSGGMDDLHDITLLKQRYGRYAELIATFGEVMFMPTSKLKRAPSKPTSVGRSTSFLRRQKEMVRKEVCELLDTEENYVQRLFELRDIWMATTCDAPSSADSDWRNIFPDGIDTIYAVNSAFLEELRKIVESSEDAALQDIENTQDNASAVRTANSNVDAQGLVALAKCLCDWLPRFSEPYVPYMKAQATSTQLLHDVFRSTDRDVPTPWTSAGEQKLTSLLIEPVQRLPRYALYIDGILKQLPVRHPSARYLLKARDIISDICTHDDAAPSPAEQLERLRQRVSDWPLECSFSGRLVTITDYTEIAPPYNSTGCDVGRGMLLLFTDSIVLLEKSSSATITAKALHTELETTMNPLATPNASRTDLGPDLRFIRKVRLDAVTTSESVSGRVIHLFTRFQLDGEAQVLQQPVVDSVLTLRLEGAYSGRAGRLVEEITKARIEGRFGEPERESGKWEVRATDAAAHQATLLGAIFDDSDSARVAARAGCASVRVIIDIDKHSHRPRAGTHGLRTVVAISPLRDGLWRLTVDSIDGSASREHINMSDVVQVLSKRLATLSITRFAIVDESMTACSIRRNSEVLNSIEIHARPQDDDDESQQTEAREHVRRPISPRKLLSNLLSSAGPGSQPPAFLKKDLPPLPPPAPSARARTFDQVPAKPPSRESRPASRDQPTPQSVASTRSTEILSNPLKKLEDTLMAYILALEARKGNIVGRSLKMRATADELAVNELYNNLLEDPNMMVLAAQASVDVLFAAFEKFLNVAWKDQIGQVLPYSTLQEIQVKAETLFPADFDRYVHSAVSALPPQNQRAFKSIMKLLADLLDGTGNDGDRGVLTAAFAEVLVVEGNPHDFIPLIDRFVDDTDTYFGEPVDEPQKTADGTGGHHKRARSVNSASISSNTSSLRKKFGFGTLTRANSKNEEESKVAAVWRTLSKSGRGDVSPGNSLSRGTLNRSNSTDVISHSSPRRPSSQDGPSVFKGSDIEEGPSSLMGPPSTHSLGLSTIGEHPSFIPTGPPRKKRRSSLSDLKALESSQAPSSPLWMSPSPRRPPITQQRLEDKSLPASPMPSTPSSKGGSGRFGSPSKDTPRSRLPPSFRKENSPGADRSLYVAPLRPRSSSNKPDEVTVTSRPQSSIPTLAPKLTTPQKAPSPAPRLGLSERPGAGNIVKKPSPQAAEKTSRPPVPTTATDTGSPKKLRMQSPQKIRERLQNEQATLTATQQSLQDELSKIGDELTATPSRINSVRTTAPSMVGKPNTIRPNHHSTAGPSQPSAMDLAQRVLKLESHLAKHMEETKARIEQIQNDLSSSLTVSETKCKRLDELYREANGENEALYTRFNDELGRVLKAVKAGEGVEELRRKLRESQEECAKVKREAGRLKREVVGLRAQLRE